MEALTSTHICGGAMLGVGRHGHVCRSDADHGRLARLPMHPWYV